MEERRLVCMTTGVALRVVAGVALLAYAQVREGGGS
jgi:hypothetical protein